MRVALPVCRGVNNERAASGVGAAVIELDWLRRLANVNEFSATSAPIIFSRDNPLIIGSVSELVFVRTTARDILRINPAVRQTTG